MNVRFVIYSHRSRAAAAQALLKEAPKDTMLFVDPVGLGHVGSVENVLRTYLISNGELGLDYLVLMEDDLFLSPEFGPSVCRALEANKAGRVVTFFSVSKEVSEARERGEAWIKSRSIAWLQCVAYPFPLIPKILEYYRSDAKFFDNIISAYCWDQDDWVMQTVPSLVQHKELRSTIGNPTRIGGKPRQSKCFGTGILTDFSKGYDEARTSIVQNPRSQFERLIKTRNQWT